MQELRDLVAAYGEAGNISVAAPLVEVLHKASKLTKIKPGKDDVVRLGKHGSKVSVAFIRKVLKAVPADLSTESLMEADDLPVESAPSS